MPFLFISSAEPPMSLWPAGFPGEAVRGGWARAKQDVMTHSLLCPVGGCDEIKPSCDSGPPLSSLQGSRPVLLPQIGGWGGDRWVSGPLHSTFPISCCLTQYWAKGSGRGAPQSPPEPLCVSISKPQLFPQGHGQSPEGCWVSCEPSFRKR